MSSRDCVCSKNYIIKITSQQDSEQYHSPTLIKINLALIRESFCSLLRSIQIGYCSLGSEHSETTFTTHSDQMRKVSHFTLIQVHSFKTKQCDGLGTKLPSYASRPTRSTNEDILFRINYRARGNSVHSVCFFMGQQRSGEKGLSGAVTLLLLSRGGMACFHNKRKSSTQ